MIPVERKIEYFNKYDEINRELGTLAGKFDLPPISLRKLKNVISANEDDIYLYEIYDLNEKQLIEINKLIKNPINYSLDKYDYCLTCFAIKGYYNTHKTKGNRKGGYPAPNLH